MQTTTNYDLKVYEGTDLFNPLTVENENITAIDEAMKDNADNSVTTANHLKSNSIHALTRINGDARMFTFKATSNYELGDSFTVDGVAVTTLTVTGSSIPSGAFVIGSVVLCSLVGQLLTIYGVGGAEAENSLKLGGELPSYYAKQSDMTSTSTLAESASELANTNSGRIDELNNSLAKLENISNEEVVIGTWSDGKTLYRKPIKVTISTYQDSSNRRLLYYNLPEEYNVKKCYGSYAMTRSSGTYNYIFGSTFIGATLAVEYTSGCYANQIRFEHNYALGVTKIVTDLVIEYTKN